MAQTYTTHDLVKNAARTSAKILLAYLESQGVKPKYTSVSDHRTLRIWGKDALVAATRLRQELDARKTAREQRKAEKAATKASPPDAIPTPTVQEMDADALRALDPPVAWGPAPAAPQPTPFDGQITHRLGVMESKIDAVLDLLTQVIDHLTRPQGNEAPMTDGFKEFMDRAVASARQTTDD